MVVIVSAKPTAPPVTDRSYAPLAVLPKLTDPVPALSVISSVSVTAVANEILSSVVVISEPSDTEPAPFCNNAPSRDHAVPDPVVSNPLFVTVTVPPAVVVTRYPTDGAVKTFSDAGKSIYICGNGGSSSIAAQMVVDIVKCASLRKPAKFKMMCLSDSIATLTAYANDEGYETVFVEPLRNFAEEGRSSPR